MSDLCTSIDRHAVDLAVFSLVCFCNDETSQSTPINAPTHPRACYLAGYSLCLGDSWLIWMDGHGPRLLIRGDDQPTCEPLDQSENCVP